MSDGLLSNRNSLLAIEGLPSPVKGSPLRPFKVVSVLMGESPL